MRPLFININKLSGLLRICVATTLLMLMATASVHFIYNHKVVQSETCLYFLSLFNLSGENTIASWYSSMLLCLIGFIALLCYCSEDSFARSTGGFLRHGWTFMSIVFIGMSLDEMGSIHENLGAITSLDALGDGSWQSVIAIPLLLVFGYMMLFALFHLRKNLRALIFLGLGCALFLSIPIQEHFEMQMWSESNYDAAWQRPILFVLLEEGAELAASICFLAGMIDYIRRQQGVVIITVYFRSTRAVPILLTASLIALGALFFFSAQSSQGADEGIAINWFPSVINFMILMMLLAQRRVSRLTSYALIVISALFGMNFHAVLNWDAILYVRIVVSIVLIAGCIATTFSLRKHAGQIANLALYLWMISILVSLFIASPATTMATFISALLFVNSDALMSNPRPAIA